MHITTFFDEIVFYFSILCYWFPKNNNAQDVMNVMNVFIYWFARKHNKTGKQSDSLTESQRTCTHLPLGHTYQKPINFTMP